MSDCERRCKVCCLYDEDFRSVFFKRASSDSKVRRFTQSYADNERGLTIIIEELMNMGWQLAIKHLYECPEIIGALKLKQSLLEGEEN